MLEILGSILDLKSLLADIVTGNASFLTYLVLFFVPFCILITIREFMAWFSKRSQLIRRVNKLEKILNRISLQLDSLPVEIEKAIRESNQQSRPSTNSYKEQTSQNENITTEKKRNYENFVINEEKFKL